MATKKIKVIVLGDTNVGKTSLVSKICDEKDDGFLKIRVPSVGASFKTVFMNDFEFCIWDIANDDRSKELLNLYIKNTNIAIIVVDTSNKKSFQSPEYWINQIKENTIRDGGGSRDLENINLIVVGNKIDKSNIEEEKRNWLISSFISNAKIIYTETSSKTNVGIEKIKNQLYLLARGVDVEYIPPPPPFNTKKKCTIF